MVIALYKMGSGLMSETKISNCITERRCRRVKLSMQSIDNLSDENLINLQNFMGIVVDMEAKYYDRNNYYVVARPTFDKVFVGRMVPEYAIIIQEHDEEMSFCWELIK